MHISNVLQNRPPGLGSVLENGLRRTCSFCARQPFSTFSASLSKILSAEYYENVAFHVRLILFVLWQMSLISQSCLKTSRRKKQLVYNHNLWSVVFTSWPHFCANAQKKEKTNKEIERVTSGRMPCVCAGANRNSAHMMYCLQDLLNKWRFALLCGFYYMLLFFSHRKMYESKYNSLMKATDLGVCFLCVGDVM